MMTETWKPVVGYEGKYEVSDHGRVRACGRWVPHARAREGRAWRKGSLLRPRPMVDGRLFINLFDGTGQPGVRTVGVAVLVAEAFIGPRPQGLECCHRDGDPLHDHWPNLYWGTHKENMEDMRRHGKRRFGHQPPNTKLTEHVVREIRAAYPVLSMQDLADQFGVSVGNIRCIIRRKTWKHIDPFIPPAPSRRRSDWRSKRGEDHASARLTEEQVREIRRSTVRGDGVKLARRFGVSTAIISEIRRGKTWKHVA